MDMSSENTPLKNLLVECKARTSASSGCDNILIRSYHFFCGREITFYHGLVLDVLVAYETFRQCQGIVLFQQLMNVIAYFGGSLFVVSSFSIHEQLKTLI